MIAIAKVTDCRLKADTLTALKQTISVTFRCVVAAMNDHGTAQLCRVRYYVTITMTPPRALPTIISTQARCSQVR